MNVGAGCIQPRVQRRNVAAPDKAEVTTRRLRGGRAQLEGAAFPQTGAMEVDLVLGHVDRADPPALPYGKSKPTIERHHRVGVSHGHRDMVEARDLTALLGRYRHSGRGGGANPDHLFDKRASRRSVRARAPSSRRPLSECPLHHFVLHRHDVADRLDPVGCQNLADLDLLALSNLLRAG